MIKFKDCLTNIHFQDPAANDNPQSSNFLFGLSLVITLLPRRLKCLLQATFSLIMCKMVTCTSGFQSTLSTQQAKRQWAEVEWA